MIFLLYLDGDPCPYRRSGRVLARLAGIKGFSLATLSNVLGCERLIGGLQ